MSGRLEQDEAVRPGIRLDVLDRAAEVEQPGVGLVQLLIGEADEQCQDDADQQLNKANPRLFDFRGAIQDIKANARPTASSCSSRPTCATCSSLAPNLRRQPLSQAVSARTEGSPVFVLASFRTNKAFFNETNKVVGQLTFFRTLVRRFNTPQTVVWEFSMSSRPWETLGEYMAARAEHVEGTPAGSHPDPPRGALRGVVFRSAAPTRTVSVPRTSTAS